ncbi:MULTISPECIES: hypothetical protein [unclassified Burkholderia]|uniref:hypothetical protein n=1 Tax=unclassified Burkholderia TaxID=2613784 RepID=UPI0015C5BA1B|nr:MULTISPECIES: hypothetical protein [unclassified Burkholderia]
MRRQVAALHEGAGAARQSFRMGSAGKSIGKRTRGSNPRRDGNTKPRIAASRAAFSYP